MTAPEFTHPGILQLGADKSSDQELVHRLFQRIDRAGVSTVLVGHSHYDHLMDVPTILHNELPNARVISTPTTRFVLEGDALLDIARVIAVDTLHAASRSAKGEWQYIKGVDGGHRFRVLPVISTHAPNVGGYTIANETLYTKLDALPTKPSKWPKGEVYGFFIDIISRDSTPLFRIYYQDSASDPDHSVLPPFTGKDVRRPDLAIICGGNFQNTEAYPTVLLREMKPRFTMIGHWEDFFRDPEDKLQVIPGLNGSELRDRVREFMDTRWATLALSVWRDSSTPLPRLARSRDNADSQSDSLHTGCLRPRCVRHQYYQHRHWRHNRVRCDARGARRLLGNAHANVFEHHHGVHR